MVSGIGPAKLKVMLEYFGSLGRAWQATESQLQHIGVDKRAIQALSETRSSIDLEAELARIKSAKIDLLTWDSPNYPRYLRELPNPPPLLYVRGDILEIDQWAVAIVGTRRLTT